MPSRADTSTIGDAPAVAAFLSPLDRALEKDPASEMELVSERELTSEKGPASAIPVALSCQAPPIAMAHSSATEPMVCLLCKFVMCYDYVHLFVVYS